MDDDGRARSAASLAAALNRQVRSSKPEIIVLDAVAVGWFEGGVLAVIGPEVDLQLHPTRLIVATGSYDIPDLYPRNDLPGTMLHSAAERLLHLDGVRPGNVAVIVTADDTGLAVSHCLREHGIAVAAIVDRRSAPRAAHEAGVTVVQGGRIQRAHGRRTVSAVTIAEATGHRRRLRCDLVIHALGERPAEELSAQWHADAHRDPSARIWTVGSAAATDGQPTPGLVHAAHIGTLAAQRQAIRARHF